MAFSSLAEFWRMGGYGFYVWLAVGISLLALLGLVWQTLGQKQALLRELVRKQAREQRRHAMKQDVMKEQHESKT